MWARTNLALPFNPKDGSFLQYHRRIKRSSCHKEWLVIVYMAADNDLSPYSWRDLWEMEAVGPTVSVDTVVFRDGSEPGMSYRYIVKNLSPIDYKTRLEESVRRYGWETLSSEAQEERFLEREGRSIVISPEVKRLPEGSSAARSTAEAFLSWAFKEFPSRRVLLVGWSHGEGFDSRLSNASTTGKPGGFAFDEHCDKNVPCDEHMHVTEMALQLREWIRTFRGGRPIDIMGSDACLNQQLEFAFEWLGVADYLFGSSTIVQKKGFNYRSLLSYLTSRPYTETAQVAAMIPKLYGSSVNPHNHSQYASYRDSAATMATWTVAELPRLAIALDDVAAFLIEFINGADSRAEEIARKQFLLDLMGVDGETKARWRNESVASTIRLGKVSMDLFNWFQALGTWIKIEQENLDPQSEAFATWQQRARRVNEARGVLFRSVLSSYVGPKYFEGLVKTSLGVALWAPHSQSDFELMWPHLEKGAFYRKSLTTTGWAKLIQRLR